MYVKLKTIILQKFDHVNNLALLWVSVPSTVALLTRLSIHKYTFTYTL